MPITTPVGEKMCFSYVGELTIEVYVIVYITNWNLGAPTREGQRECS